MRSAIGGIEPRTAHFGLAFAVGLSGYRALRDVAGLVVVALWPQNALAVPGFPGFFKSRPYLSIIHGHVLYYGATTGSIVAVAFATVLAWWALHRLGIRSWNRADLTMCPSCRAVIPTRATVCRFCTRDQAR
jgi:ribosomal protein L40E